MKFYKTIILLCCASCLAGCAPHYFFFDLIESLQPNNKTFKVINNAVVARHISGNHIDIFQSLELLNLTNETFALKQYSFKANSTVFIYDLLNINQDTGTITNPGSGIVLYAKDTKDDMQSINIKGRDTLKLTVIYKLNEKLSEPEFKSRREGEKVTVNLLFNELKYVYIYRAKNN